MPKFGNFGAGFVLPDGAAGGSIPADTMQAMVIHQFGGPEVFQLGERPKPEVKAGQLLIQVAASSVNPVDAKIRSGALPAIAPELPAILHGDVAGTVAAVGEGVAGFKPGDEVYACAGGFQGLDGALAEFMVADADLVAPKPAKLSLAEAAALPLVGITAWEALVERAGVRPGQRVLVHAAAGGVGHVGVQLAKCAGAIVFTTVSSEAKAALAAKLGADFVINYREQKVPDYVAQHTGGEGFDVVFDTVGGDSLAASFQAVRVGGTVVTIAARSTQDLSPLHGKGATLHVVFMLIPLLQRARRARHGEILRNLARLVDCGRLAPVVDPEEFTFRTVGAAHRKLQAGRAVGKICLKVGF
jgi:NADPH:quinone reductase